MSTVLGIDLSSRNIDLVWLDEDGPGARWARLPLAGPTSFARCRAVRAAMPPATAYDGCYLAAIERPRTQSMVSAAALFPVFGAVLSCLPAALEVWDVLPQHWKQGLGLGGNASKEEAAREVYALAEPAVLGWATNGMRGPVQDVPQDALDAWAVAFYARELNARGIGAEEARERQLVLLPAAAPNPQPEPERPLVPLRLEG